MALSVLLSGDSILQRRLNSRDDAELRPLFDKVRAADVAFTNLEGLANDYRGDPALESGGSHFGAPAWVLDELVAAGFDLFATATNMRSTIRFRALCTRSRRWRLAGFPSPASAAISRMHAGPATTPRPPAPWR